MLGTMKRLVLLSCLISTSVFAAAAPAKPAAKAAVKAGPPKPVLKIETGGHTAAIHHVSVHASGRWLLTTSADRTARVWDLKAGKLGNETKLEHTIRLNLGPGVAAAIYTGVISPN